MRGKQFIDVDGTLMSQGETEKGKGFEPIDLTGNKRFSPDSGKEPVENGNPFEDLEQSAYTEGFMKGEKAGMESEREKLRNILDTFEKAMSELLKLYHDAVIDYESAGDTERAQLKEKIDSYRIKWSAGIGELNDKVTPQVMNEMEREYKEITKKYASLNS